MRLRYTFLTAPDTTRAKSCRTHPWPSGLTDRQFLDKREGPDSEKCPKCEATRERVIG